jgi:hypothetical protein
LQKEFSVAVAFANAIPADDAFPGLMVSAHSSVEVAK